jgi:two-component system, NtrC family, sensor kinase
VLGVPMLREDVAVGVLALTRSAVRPFSDEQIALVENFADQAVIAIENARLLNELRQRTAALAEALEQQTATSEVLQVISGSAGDLQPVFAAMLENAARICDANFGKSSVGMEMPCGSSRPTIHRLRLSNIADECRFARTKQTLSARC